METFLSTFYRLVLLIKIINTCICCQFLGLDFYLLTGNWEKNIVAELPVVLAEAEPDQRLAEAETEKTSANCNGVH